jgi:hypothetical protein
MWGKHVRGHMESFEEKIYDALKTIYAGSCCSEKPTLYFPVYIIWDIYIIWP